MDLIDTILSRRSIRKYNKAKPIKPQDLQAVLTAAMYAPSGMNKQSWMFAVVDDKKVQKQLMDVHPYADFLSDAGMGIIICEDTEKSYGGFGPIDSALAAENMMLAAHTMGYGTCYCGVYPNEERMEQFAKILKCPTSVRPIALIVIGTPDQQPPRPNRFDAAKIVHNRF